MESESALNQSVFFVESLLKLFRVFLFCYCIQRVANLLISAFSRADSSVASKYIIA